MFCSSPCIARCFEEKEKRRVRSAFGQYLSPEVIRRLLVNPQLVEPKKTEITVMFSDIPRLYHHIRKTRRPGPGPFLNQYLSDMTRPRLSSTTALSTNTSATP